MRRLCLLIALAACGDPEYQPWILEELTPAQGFHVRTPEFEVPSGTEIQDCYFFRVPDLAGGADLMIDRVALALNTGSHHMNVFRVKTIVGLDPAAGEPVELGGVHGTVVRGSDPASPCWKSPNWADWPLVSNSQQSAADQQIIDWALPANVATRLSPGEQLMLQVHYVNATDQVTPFVGRAGVNFYRSTDGDTIELGTLFATQQSIRVCRSNPRPSYSGVCALPAGSHIATAANGHFHGRGKRFRIWGWDGTSTTTPGDDALFYESKQWDEPDMKVDLDYALPSNGGVWWTCDYQWVEPAGGCAAVDARDPEQAGDCCYTFGPTVETSEHCNVFLYYYPKVTGDVTCF
ncbi:MAG: hypothetical protein ACTHU0_28640 [Kofleriaceae bacterium]